MRPFITFIRFFLANTLVTPFVPLHAFTVASIGVIYKKMKTIDKLTSILMFCFAKFPSKTLPNVMRRFSFAYSFDSVRPLSRISRLCPLTPMVTPLCLGVVTCPKDPFRPCILDNI